MLPLGVDAGCLAAAAAAVAAVLLSRRLAWAEPSLPAPVAPARPPLAAPAAPAAAASPWSAFRAGGRGTSSVGSPPAPSGMPSLGQLATTALGALAADVAVDLLRNAFTDQQPAPQPAPAETASLAAVPCAPGAPRDVIALVDVSYSMAGERLWQAKAALSEFWAGMGDLDGIALMTFSGHITTVLPFALKPLHTGFLPAVHAMDTDSSTAFYDAILEGVSAAEARQNIFLSHGGEPGTRGFVALLVTDGEDVSSSASLADAEAAIERAQRRGIEVIIIAMGEAATCSSVRVMREGGKARVVRVAADEDIPAAFKHVLGAFSAAEDDAFWQASQQRARQTFRGAGASLPSVLPSGSSRGGASSSPAQASVMSRWASWLAYSPERSAAPPPPRPAVPALPPVPAAPAVPAQPAPAAAASALVPASAAPSPSSSSVLVPVSSVSMGRPPALPAPAAPSAAHALAAPSRSPGSIMGSVMRASGGSSSATLSGGGSSGSGASASSGGGSGGGSLWSRALSATVKAAVSHDSSASKSSGSSGSSSGGGWSGGSSRSSSSSSSSSALVVRPSSSSSSLSLGRKSSSSSGSSSGSGGKLWGSSWKSVSSAWGSSGGKSSSSWGSKSSGGRSGRRK